MWEWAKEFAAWIGVVVLALLGLWWRWYVRVKAYSRKMKPDKRDKRGRR